MDPEPRGLWVPLGGSHPSQACPPFLCSCLNLALREELQAGEALQACTAMGAW